MKTLQLCSCAAHASAYPVHPLHPRRRLHSLLQRLQASPSAADTLTAPPAAVPASPPPVADEMTYLSPHERSTLSDDQKAFMVRKRKAAMGLGPVMPAECSCAACAGVGTLVCHQCGGSGTNATDKAAELFLAEGTIRVNNGLLHPQWMFMKGGPCWLCKGQAQVACSDCSGTGIRGGVDRYTGD